MSDRRRDESKELRKDQQIRREVLDEIGSEIAQDHTGAQYRNPNRDQARGDWHCQCALRDGIHANVRHHHCHPTLRSFQSPLPCPVARHDGKLIV